MVWNTWRGMFRLHMIIGVVGLVLISSACVESRQASNSNLNGAAPKANPTKAVGQTMTGQVLSEKMYDTFDGQTIRIGGVQKHIQVLHIWASWCTTCNEEAPGLSEQIAKLPKDTQFVGVNAIQYDDRDEAWDFVSRYQWKFPQIYDEKNELGKMLRVSSYPSTVVLDQKGKVIYQGFGPLDVPAVKDAIHALSEN